MSCGADLGIDGHDELTGPKPSPVRAIEYKLHPSDLEAQIYLLHVGPGEDSTCAYFGEEGKLDEAQSETSLLLIVYDLCTQEYVHNKSIGNA